MIFYHNKQIQIISFGKSVLTELPLFNIELIWENPI